MPLAARRIELSDLGEINSWYQERGLTALDAELLPKTGYIVPQIAVGFLYMTDSNMALLEGYITNPRASKRACITAIDSITSALLQAANELGVKHVLAFCDSHGIKRIAQRRHGMSEVGNFSLVTRKIS
jgi:hypothetical protein